MHLTPKDEDRLLLFLAAELARKRHAAGLALSYPEARAIIADEVLEAARAGRTVPEAAEHAASVLSEADLLPGVAALIGTVQVEGFFPDGQKLVTIHTPVRPVETAGPATPTPGEVLAEDGEIEINVGRPTTVVQVVNTGDRPIQVGSHFHFFEVNRALSFDRRASYGRRLDIPSGTAVRFEAGEEQEVTLVPVAGTREIFGLNNMIDGPLSESASDEDMARLQDAGFAHVGTTEGQVQ